MSSIAADPIVISSYARTPMGAFQGALSTVKSTALGSVAIKAALERAGLRGSAVDQVLMGCVLSAGLGQAPARQAALGAGLPVSAQATTINKMCGSGLQAAAMGYDALRAGTADVILAGGMESMTGAPYLMSKHRSGARIGHDAILDAMYLDGLEDAYTPRKLMGAFAEEVAQTFQFTRDEQDGYARESLERARNAQTSGLFQNEIVPVRIQARSGDVIVAADEQPQRADPNKIATLKPAFAPDGTVTAASSASISDGAAALVMTRQSVAEKLHLPVIAKIAAHAAYAGEPGQFPTAPVFAIRNVLDRADWDVGSIDLWEVNEAFAIVAMIAMRELTIPREKMNVNGGACALGHPIGASGARLLCTLLAALKTRGLRRGVASLCIGGGEGIAMALEVQ